MCVWDTKAAVFRTWHSVPVHTVMPLPRVVLLAVDRSSPAPSIWWEPSVPDGEGEVALDGYSMKLKFCELL
jgi:hypothetical protein